MPRSTAVLPAPLAPRTATMLPVGTRMFTACAATYTRSYVTSTEVRTRSRGAGSGLKGPLPSQRPQAEVAPQLAEEERTDAARLEQDEHYDRDAVQPRLHLVSVLAEAVDEGHARKPAVDGVVDD